MKLIVGLGNPGLKYTRTWHNLGFILADGLKKLHGFSDFKLNSKLNAAVSQGKIAGEKVILAKPTTFMNNSGLATQALAHFYKIPTKDIWVLHDEADLPIGKIRISQGASAAGHNGIKSITQTLGSKDFVRFRIGIKPTASNKQSIDKYVLQKINKPSIVPVNQALDQAAQAIAIAIEQGVGQAMNQFN